MVLVVSSDNLRGLPSDMAGILKDRSFPVYFVGFMDLFGVSLILPLLLSHARVLGASPTLVGIFGSVYGGLQLVFSPIMGRWSDLSGRRLVLMLSLVLSACGYFTMGLAVSVPLMFFARIPLGIFKQSQNISKSYLADVVPEAQQSLVLGRFNAASSIGFILGPIVGGHIAERPGGFYMAAMCAAIIFFINSGIVWFFIPEIKTEHQFHTTKQDPAMVEIIQDSANSTFSPKVFFDSLRTIRWWTLWDLFLIKFCLGFSVLVFRSNFSLMAIEKFETSPSINGYLISYSGIVSAVCGFFVGWISNQYRNNGRLLCHMSIIQMLSLFGLAVAPSLWMLVICLTPLSFVTTVSRVAGTSLTIQRGRKEEVGVLLGLSQSVMSLARMMSPMLAGLTQEVSVMGPAVLGGGASAIAVLIMFFRPQDKIPYDKKYS
ncbi:hypothetical protein ScPMuIL_013401 [Solemya velum]